MQVKSLTRKSRSRYNKEKIKFTRNLNSSVINPALASQRCGLTESQLMTIPVVCVKRLGNRTKEIQ